MKIHILICIFANLAIIVQGLDHHAGDTEAAEVDIERFEEEWLKYVGPDAIFTPDTFMEAMRKAGEEASERKDYNMYLYDRRRIVLMYFNLKRCRKVSR